MFSSDKESVAKVVSVFIASRNCESLSRDGGTGGINYLSKIFSPRAGSSREWFCLTHNKACTANFSFYARVVFSKRSRKNVRKMHGNKIGNVAHVSCSRI